MRVFLTGATGFVGSHVARLLVERGHEVHALVLDGDPRRERAGDVAIVSGDLLRPETYAAALEKLRPEACLHLGWYANPADYLSSRINIDLLGASAALGAKLVDLGCSRILMAGTCFEYDTSIGFLSESTPLAPRHLYSTCKRALFDVMNHIAGPASFVWTRLFFLYGPNEQPGRLVSAVIDALQNGREARVTTGEQYRDFLHVADAAAGIVSVFESDLTGPVNVASGKPVQVREVVATIARLLGKEDRVAWGAITPRAGDPTFVCADVAKLASTGFRPQFDLESGIRQVLTLTR
jgi:nucleoside-diphosphate-sugar epimerase